MRPVFGSEAKRKEDGAEVSFLQLAEIVVVSGFRHRGVALERLRRAHAFAKRNFNLDYPFASIKLRTDGTHILHEFEVREPGGRLLSLDQRGQLALPGSVLEVLQSFDFEDEWAARWYPAGKDVPIVVDPRYAAGRPAIPGRSVTVDTLYERWQAGQAIEFIAREFRLRKNDVEMVLQHAGKLAA
jgi:uncharacterized protein (DUF433 family)